LIRETWLGMVRSQHKACCISMLRPFHTDLWLTNRGAAKLLWTNTNKYDHDDSYLLR